MAFREGFLQEILYAGDLMISAQSMDELSKLTTYRSEIEKKELRVNMGKINLMVSGSNFDVLRKPGKYPCGLCQTGVGRSAILVVVDNGYTRNAVA